MTIHLNLKTIGIGVAAIALLWHIAVALMPNVSISGLFMAKPAASGYGWIDTGNADSRFFWQTTSVRWQAGLQHATFQCEASEQEGVWNPLAGYTFVDKAQGQNTAWKAGLKHPDFMAWSDDVEGRWIPVTGYKFIYEGDTFVDTVWDPNKRYDDVKVISMAEKDHYNPFPGYTFVEPGKSLKVAWRPGTINYENSRLAAGTREGTWVINSNPPTTSTLYASRRRGTTGRDVGIFLGGVATGVVLDRVIR